MAKQNQLIATTKCQISLLVLEKEIYEHLNQYEDTIWAYAQKRNPTHKDKELLLTARQELRTHVGQIFKRAQSDEVAKNALDITFKAYAKAAERRFEKIEILEPGFINLVDSIREITVEANRD